MPYPPLVRGEWVSCRGELVAFHHAFIRLRQGYDGTGQRHHLLSAVQTIYFEAVMECFIDMLSDYLVLTITVVILVLQYLLAKRSHKLEEQRLKMDLFDKRWKIYMRTIEFIKLCESPGLISMQDAFSFYNDVRYAKLIFKDDVINLIDEIDDKGVRFGSLNEKYDLHIHTVDSDVMTSDEIRGKNKLHEWFLRSRVNVHKTFEPYLKIV